MKTTTSKEVLVTGGTGFIGSHLLSSLKKDGYRATSVSLGPPKRQRFVEDVEYLYCDLTSKLDVKKKLNRPFDYVVNLSGYVDHTPFSQGGERLINSHFIALQNLIEVLPRKSLQRFVHIGSSDEYGATLSPQHEELRERAFSPYSLAKIACTQLLQMLYTSENFPAVVLRLFLPYGPRQNLNHFLPQVITGCLNNEKIPISPGYQVRDFCHIDDVILAIKTAFSVEEANGHIFNISSGKPISIRDITKMVVNIVGTGNPDFGALRYKRKENMSLFADIQKAKNMLHWEPRFSLEEGLLETIHWFKKNNS